MLKTISNYQKDYDNTINITLNHIFIVYAFFIPISVGGYAQSFLFTLMLLLVALRGNYLNYFAYSVKHPVVMAFYLYALMHFIWLLGTENLQWAERMIDQSNKALYPILFMSFLDKRFSLPILSGFLLGVMLSELISYAIHFQLIPWKFILHDVLYPWKSHIMDIVIYSAHSHEDPSPFLHHSFYAATLALSASILIYRILKEKFSFFTQTISIIFISTMTLNMLIVGGRTGYSLYIILLITLLLLIYKKNVFRPIVISLLVLGLIFSITYKSGGLFTQRIDQSIHTLEKLNENTHNFNSSLGYRLGVWYYGLDLIKESPFLGVGTGDHMDKLRADIEEKNSFLKIMLDMHNQYFEILLQFGLVGLIVFLNIFYQIIRFKSASQEIDGIKTLILVSMIVTGITATYWHYYLPLYTVLLSAILVTRQTIPDNISWSHQHALVFLGILTPLSYLIEKLQ